MSRYRWGYTMVLPPGYAVPQEYLDSLLGPVQVPLPHNGNVIGLLTEATVVVDNGQNRGVTVWVDFDD